MNEWKKEVISQGPTGGSSIHLDSAGTCHLYPVNTVGWKELFFHEMLHVLVLPLWCFLPSLLVTPVHLKLRWALELSEFIFFRIWNSSIHHKASKYILLLEEPYRWFWSSQLGDGLKVGPEDWYIHCSRIRGWLRFQIQIFYVVATEH